MAPPPSSGGAVVVGQAVEGRGDDPRQQRGETGRRRAQRRVEVAGLIAGTWTTGAGRRRREYELTELGRGALRTERSIWRDFVSTIGAALEPAHIEPTQAATA